MAARHDAHADLGRQEAQRLYPGPLACEHDGCGTPAERHHVDGDTHNNARSNVRFLCRKHHHEEDARCQRPDYRARNSAARKGRRNPASLNNLGPRQQPGYQKSAEHREALSAAQRGKKRGPWSPERRAAFSVMKTKWYADRRAK